MPFGSLLDWWMIFPPSPSSTTPPPPPPLRLLLLLVSPTHEHTALTPADVVTIIMPPPQQPVSQSPTTFLSRTQHPQLLLLLTLQLRVLSLPLARVGVMGRPAVTVVGLIEVAATEAAAFGGAGGVPPPVVVALVKPTRTALLWNESAQLSCHMYSASGRVSTKHVLQ